MIEPSRCATMSGATRLASKRLFRTLEIIAASKTVASTFSSDPMGASPAALQTKMLGLPTLVCVSLGQWLKIKTRMQQEAVIGGITEPSGGRKYFGALMLGVYEKGRLLYVGHTGTGFSEATLKELFTKLKPLFTDKCPFTLKPKAKLLVIRRGVGERIIEATAIPFRGVHKSVEIFLDIDRLEEQAFVTNLLGVFDQNSCGAIDAPHSKSRPKKSAVRVKFFQPRHRMEAIDRHSILAMNECENSKFHLPW